MPIRVVIAEDSYLVREGVVRLLEAQEDIEVVGACGDFDELIATVDAELPDVVLTDIRMPPTGTDEGVRAANQLRENASRDRRRDAEPVRRARVRARAARARLGRAARTC